MNHENQPQAIVYGGAFNPPTLAHIAILRACAEYAKSISAELWIMPSGDRVDKTIPVPRKVRLQYIDAMIMDSGLAAEQVRVITNELDRVEPVETYDTVTELSRDYPEYQMTWVFGADSTQTMAEWKEGNWLLENLDKVLIERAGSEIDPRARRATLLSIETPEVSSTEVRRRMANREPIDGLVGPTVALLLV